MMTHDEMIAVIQAEKEKRIIQVQYLPNGAWHDCGTPAWDFCNCNYRVNPLPVPPGDLTWEQAELAHKDGKQVQVMSLHYGVKWEQVRGIFSNHDFQDKDKWAFRLAPEPKRVPLTAEDLPPVCWLSPNDPDISYLVVSVRKNGLCFEHDTLVWDYETLMKRDWHYSSDRKNWKPCYKEEAQ